MRKETKKKKNKIAINWFFFLSSHENCAHGPSFLSSRAASTLQLNSNCFVVSTKM